jgi:hypothetical protein
MSTSLFTNLSSQGQALITSLNKLAPQLPDAMSANQWPVDFLNFLNELNGLSLDEDSLGHGPDVPPEDAALSGSLFLMAEDGTISNTPAQTAAAKIRQGHNMVVGGCGLPLEDFYFSAGQIMLATGSQAPFLMQYVGLDQSHWSTDSAAKVERNILTTALLLLVNSATNGYNGPDQQSVIFSYGFASWIVNRSLRALAPSFVKNAKNMQLDGFGPLDAMQELYAVKLGGYGKICNVQSTEGLASVEKTFGVSAAVAKRMPVDITLPAG